MSARGPFDDTLLAHKGVRADALTTRRFRKNKCKHETTTRFLRTNACADCSTTLFRKNVRADVSTTHSLARVCARFGGATCAGMRAHGRFDDTFLPQDFAHSPNGLANDQIGELTLTFGNHIRLRNSYCYSRPKRVIR